MRVKEFNLSPKNAKSIHCKIASLSYEQFASANLGVDINNNIIIKLS